MSDPRKVFVDTFEYIKQLLQLGKAPVYSVSEYRTMEIRESHLQGLPGVNHSPDSSDGSPVWLEIARLKRGKAPRPPEKLVPWLKQSDDPKREASLEEWITVTKSREELDKIISDGTAAEENVLESLVEPGMFDVRLFSKDCPEISSGFEDYIQRTWLPWSQVEQLHRQAIDIYEKLFEVHQRMALGEVTQPIELVWGIGHAVWRAPDSGKTISHPIIEVFVEVELETDTQVLKIRPRSVTNERPRIFTAPFEDLNIPGVKPLKEQFEAEINRMEAQEQSIHPFDPSSFEAILKMATTHLSQDAYYRSASESDVTNREVPRPDKSLVITDTWAIYARARGADYLIQDIERFQKKARSEEKVNKSVAIKFATEPSSEKPKIMGWGQDGFSVDLKDIASLELDVRNYENGNNIYFPKAFNDAQRDIIDRLDKSDGVVVQGPPGTGKTHTIANIICHYLATGRRVLVTAKSETALEVLKKQIPSDIQPLIISMVSNDREGVEQQKEAIETLQVKVVGLQGRERQIARDIKEGEEEVSRLKQEISKIEQEVRSLASRQLTAFEFEWAGKVFGNAGDLSKWVTEHRDSFLWFPDHLGTESKFDPLFSDADISKLIQAKETSRNDISYLNLKIPQTGDLPNLETIERIHRDLVTANNLENAATKEGFPRFSQHSIETNQIAEDLVEDIKDVQSWIEKNDSEWLLTLFEAQIHPEKPASSWVELFHELRPEIASVVADRKTFLRKKVEFDADIENARALVRTASERGRNGRKPVSWTQMFNKETKAAVASIKVLNKAPESIEDWQHVESWLDFLDTYESLAARWLAIKDEAPIPELQADPPAKTFEEILGRMEELERIATKVSERVWPNLERIFDKSSGFHGVDPKPNDLKHVAECIEQNLSMYRLRVSDEFRKQTIEKLRNYSCPEAEELCQLLENRVGSDHLSPDELVKTWRSNIDRFRHLGSLQNSFETIREVIEKINQSGAVQWAAELGAEPITRQEKERLINWKEAWRWKRLDSFLQTLDFQEKLLSMEKERQEKEERIKKIFGEVVKQRTFLMLCQSMTDRAKTGLAKFMAAISRIGRGAGIKAPIYIRSAQKAMLECADAIPCWIMPSWRVSEVLPSEFDFFDLVIVDEASQCDIRELPAVARAKKLLIVGDDNQVSPTPPFIEFNKFLQLKRHYLDEQPFGDIMLPGYSLYDLASAVFPGNKIILNEHFRCVEPIIRFSFQFYSGVTIHPLRIPKATERIDPPLVDIFVKDGEKRNDLNLQEANAIVDEIEKIVSDKDFENRSIGVISLIGRKQSLLIQKKLLERIGQEKYLAHRIVCGDSATFQGREKDIVFLSMIASPGRSRTQTDRSIQQRFNVAASRARDRLYLVRSVELDDLKPNDLKHKLLSHLRDPMPQANNVDQEMIERCESDFEREVFRELTTKGYLTIPQVPVGEYRIDLVVEGDNDRRLAVELDGDRYHGPEKWLDDYTRQKVLERVGWKFWRCWASSYISDPDGCLSSLISRLDEMGIKPQGGNPKSFVYTETREVETPDEGPETAAAEELERDEVVEVGDKVILTFEDRNQGAVTVAISEDRSEPQNLIFSRNDPVALALIDCAREDEVEIDIFGKRQKVCIVDISKADGAMKPISHLVPEQTAEKVWEERTETPQQSKPVEQQKPAIGHPTPSTVVDLATAPVTATPEQPKPMEPKETPRSSEKYPDPNSVSIEKISEYLTEIVSQNGPIMSEHAYHIYLERAGIRRLGRQIQKRFNRSMAALVRSGAVLVVNHADHEGQKDMVVKTPDQEDVVIRTHLDRPLEMIPLNEIRALMKQIRDSQLWLDEEDIMRTVLERYGLKRLTKKAEAILNEALQGIKGTDVG